MSNYCERFDVTYTDTGSYLEAKCDDPLCDFCKTRPPKLFAACKGCEYTNCPNYKNHNKKVKGRERHEDAEEIST